MSDAPLASADVLARARNIKLFLLDVDGTVAVTSGPAEITEMNIFNAQDGQGLSLAHTMRIQTGFITGRRSPAVAKRAEGLGVTFVYLGQATKMQAFEECVEKAGGSEEEAAYMVDDLPDIPLSKRAVLAISVADGAPELKAVCDYPTRRGAGRGAAREVIELILKAQGRWNAAVPQARA
jgi:3-deoxy-D-manno-octulosonate 8-phosphate phosphatase (KDO 8-P phosphatase)